MKTTETTCVMPILGCIWAALKYLSERRFKGKFLPVNDAQRHFVRKYGHLIKEVDKIAELECKADQDVEVINAWLKHKGYDIKLSQSVGKDGFAVASILDLLLEWIEPGTKSNITGLRTGKSYPAVKMKSGFTAFEHNRFYPHPVIQLSTKSGDILKMAVLDNMNLEFDHQFTAQDLAMSLDSIDQFQPDIEKILFPMIDLDMKPDISWLVGMQHEGSGHFISEAVQQTKFRMNEKCAKVESAAAMGMRCLSMPVYYEINQPFLLWITRPGIKVPFFTAVLCEDVWKEPAKL